MAKRKLAFRKKRQNRLAMTMIMVVVAMLLLVVGIKSVELKAKQEQYAEREAALMRQIEDEMKRTEEIEEYKKYTKTKKYAEEVAKDKLGLVHDGEIIFKEKE